MNKILTQGKQLGDNNVQDCYSYALLSPMGTVSNLIYKTSPKRLDWFV